MTPPFATASRAEIMAALSAAVFEGFGKAVEEATVISSSHGWFRVKLPVGAVREGVGHIARFRRAQVPGYIRWLKRGLAGGKSKP